MLLWLKQKIESFPKFVAFICGWLSVAALPPLYCFPLLLVTISLLLWLIRTSVSAKQAFGRSYAFGFAFFAFGLSWIGNAVLLDWTALAFLYPIILLACGAFFGLFFAIPAALCWGFCNSVAQYLSFAAFMVIFEWIRSFFLTGFPWNPWGSVFAFSQVLLQSAALGGVYFLSLLALLVCGLPFLYFVNPSKQNSYLLAGVGFLIFGGMLSYGSWRLETEDKTPSETTIRLVQPSIPQAMKWDENNLEQNFSTYVELSRQKSLEGIDMVIWGETASPFPLEHDEFHNIKMRSAVPDKGYLLTGQVRYYVRQGRFRMSNSMVAYDYRGSPVAYYDKSHLVPFGEYIPFRKWLPDWLRPLANTIGTFTAGKGPTKISLPNLPDFGGAICYEAIFPHDLLNQKNRPQWVINPTNDGWYGDSFGPYQHFVAAQLRAIEDGITFVRAANNGISAVISPYGTILAYLDLNEVAVQDVDLPKQSSFLTVYSRYGNSVILVLCAVLLAIATITRLKTTKNIKI